jgi:predicted Zn finger-like uncharacterized protein
MPIVFRCPGCGSLNRVGDEMAGKAVRCGKCPTVLTVPAAGAPAPPEPEPPPAPVPEAEDVREPVAPPKRSRRREDDEDDEPRRRKGRDDEDDESRPRRRKKEREDEDEPQDLPRPRNLLKTRQRKRSRVGLILALVGVGLLSACGVCAGVSWYIWDQVRSQIAGESIYEGGGPEAKELPPLEDIRDGKFTRPPRSTTGAYYFRMASSKGDFIGGGKSYSFAPHDIKVRKTARGVEIDAGPWQADFYAADNQIFKPGEYPDARRIGEGVAPGIDVHGEGRGCNQTKGKFIVWELAVVNDQVVRLAIDFVQHCEGKGPPLYGRIRINSTFQ